MPIDPGLLSTLLPHPEGGRFREIHRASDTVTLADGRVRSALTHIYFHLGPGERSRWHRVEQDEVWNLYAGSMKLWILRESGELAEILLSPEAGSHTAIVPAGAWQAAEPAVDEALVGCTVAPGFEFADFQLLPEGHALAARIREAGLERFV